MKICPKCLQEIKGYPALSRKDNKTEICSRCGTIEALEAMKKNITNKENIEQLRKEIGELVLPTNEFNELLKKHNQWVKNYITEDNKTSFMPMIVAVSAVKEKGLRKQAVIGLAVDFEIIDKKQAFFLAGAKLAMDPRPFALVGAFLTSEAWSRSFDKDEEKPEDKQVKDYDDKIEVLVTSGLTVDGRNNGSIYRITRANDNTMLLTDERITISAKGQNVESRSFLLEEFFRGWFTANDTKGKEAGI